MKKRRSTVLVSPGKDVTLYIPTETPPEVIAYMNRLKNEGMFSHGIMDILTKHILHTESMATPFHEVAALSEGSESFAEDAFFSEEPMDGQELIINPDSNSQRDFSLEDIFRQANRNAGKLL